MYKWRPLVCKGILGLLQSKVHVASFCFPFLHTEKFNTGIWLKDAILCDLNAFLTCCFSFSFSKHILDDVCLSLVFKSVLNSVAGSGSVPSRKSCMDPVLHKHKKEACSSGPHHQTYLIGISWLQTGKNFPWLSAKYSAQSQRWQFFTDSDWQTGLVWKDVFCVCVFSLKF